MDDVLLTDYENFEDLLDAVDELEGKNDGPYRIVVADENGNIITNTLTCGG